MRKRLLTVTDTLPPDRNGIAVIVERTAPLFAKEVTLGILGPGRVSSSEPAVHWEARRLPFGAADFKLAIVGPVTLFRSVRWSDAVLVHTLGIVGLSALLAARLLRRRSIVVLHNDLPELARFYLKLDGFRARISDLICGGFERVAIWLASESVAVGGAPQAVAHHLELSPPAVETVDPAPAANGRLVVVYHGRISAEKQLLLAVEALGRLDPATRESVVLRLVGEGSGLNEVLALAERLHVEVEHVSWTDDPLRHVGAADIFVNPSRTETFSLSTLEAVGCGVPVIARRIGYIPTYVRHGENGYLFNDDDEFEGLVRELVLNRERREAMATAARSGRCQTSIWQQLTDQLMRVAGWH